MDGKDKRRVEKLDTDRRTIAGSTGRTPREARAKGAPIGARRRTATPMPRMRRRPRPPRSKVASAPTNLPSAMAAGSRRASATATMIPTGIAPADEPIG